MTQLLVHSKKLSSLGWDSSVGIATRHGLNGPGFESWWWWDFPHPSRWALGPTQLPLKWIPRLFHGVKLPGCDVDHPPTFRAEVKERVDLYLTPLLRLHGKLQRELYLLHLSSALFTYSRRPWLLRFINYAKGWMNLHLGRFRFRAEAEILLSPQRPYRTGDPPSLV
jgi:hypothetical protein